jgi:flagellar hook-associated protein 2
MATDRITLSGFNGIDFKQIVDVVMQQESRPLTALQQQEQTHKDKDAAYVNLGGQISKLQSAAATLAAPSAFSNVAVSSSDTSVIAVSTASASISGHYTVEITQLAKAQVTASTNGYSSNSDVVADSGAISFTVDGETTAAINITASTTLAGLRNAINAQNSGVVASIVNTGTTNKLVITSRQTGESHGFVINSTLAKAEGTVLTFANGQNTTTGNTQNAQDALLTVNGLSITSESNTISAVVPEITFKALKIGSADIDAVPDYKPLKDSVKSLIDAFNNLKRYYDQQQGSSGSLANDLVMRQVYSEVRRILLGSNQNGGSFHYLAEAGVEFTSTGELKLNESNFDSAVNSNLGNLQSLFIGTGDDDGVLVTLKARLTSLDSSTGAIKTARDSLKRIIAKDDDRISAMQLRLELRREALVKMYAAADEAIARMNQSTTAIQSISAGLY